MLISDHNSLRVLFDKIASVYFIWKIYLSLYFSIGNGQPREPALCQLYRHTFVPYMPKLRDDASTVLWSTSSIVDELCWQHNRLAVANFYSPEFATKFRQAVPLFWSYTNFLTAQCRTGGIKPACMPKTSLIRPSVSTEYRLMIQTDRQTDKQTEWRTQGHSQYHASKIDGWQYRIGHRRTVSHDV